MALLLRRSRTDGSDEELIEQVREGDDDAFAELYRRHAKSAAGTARWLLKSNADADDAVSDAFAGVLQALRNGRGPRENFRAYLLASVRNACYARRPVATLVGDDVLEATLPAFEDPERYVEADTIARAFATLSPRWQQALWMSEVEERSLADVGAELGLAPNAIAALRHRAREGFASAYLTEHLARAATPACASVGQRLGAYVRGSASATDVAAVDAHLADCASCRRAADELRDVNGSLRSLQGPVMATGAAATAGVTAAVISGTAVGSGFAALAGGGLLLKVAAVALLAVPVAIGGQRLLTEHSTVDEQVVLQPVSTSGAEPSAPGAGPIGGAGRTAPPADVATGGAMPVALVESPITATSVDPSAAGAGQPTSDPAAAVTTTTTAAAASASTPTLAVPGVTVGITTPPISTPAISTPGVSVPPIVVPPITTPALATPGLSTPPISTPPISLGPIVVPSVSVPQVSVPQVTVPSLGLPTITVTVPATLPPIVVLPPLTIPTISVPPLLGSG